MIPPPERAAVLAISEQMAWVVFGLHREVASSMTEGMFHVGAACMVVNQYVTPPLRHTASAQ